MKGFITRTALGLALCVGLTALVGCVRYRDIVDPCWPERYNYMANSSVNQLNNAQAYNGHVLDQTVWNWMFEHEATTAAPTDRLNPAGVEHLRYLSRRRPVPDARLYLATAQDLPGPGDLPPDLAIKQRNDLNMRRVASIQKYLAAQTNGHGAFTVEVHDPAEVGQYMTRLSGSLPPGQQRPTLGAVQKLYDNFQGVLPLESGTSSGSSGGGAGGGSGGAAPPR